MSVPLSLVAMPGHAQAPVGDVYSADATVKGVVALSAASTRVMSGSSVMAGVSNASVRLIRGGELRVCQGSSVSLTNSANGAQILVGMSSGTIETHYPLANSRDSIMTPDFEITLNGSGMFHLAVSTDQNGNTCVQSLHGNTGSAKVSELMGDGSYTVKPGEQVIFRAGHASNPGPVVGNCGCPVAIPVLRAAAEPPKPVTAPAAAPLPPVAALIESSPKSVNVTAPPPAEQPGSVHVQVEAPFVFRASDPQPAPDAPVELAEIRLSTLPVLGSVYVPHAPQEVAQAATQEAAKPKKKKRHGLWGFLASIFKG
ncbi:MAG TPA: hypothetical protein VES66_06950 [Terriglobales bacterium]|nr:hypothetical protein [Terriglobales bacterium]